MLIMNMVIKIIEKFLIKRQAQNRSGKRLTTTSIPTCGNAMSGEIPPCLLYSYSNTLNSASLENNHALYREIKIVGEKVIAFYTGNKFPKLISGKQPTLNV